MSLPQIERKKIKMRPLAERTNKLDLTENQISSSSKTVKLSKDKQSLLDLTVERIKAAKKTGAPVMLSFGAHTIKNGLGPILIKLLEAGWFTHLATNGAGIIHDWEFAFQGESSEDVKKNLAAGTFGNWEETGRYLNLALNTGAYEGKGYGESVGTMIQHESLTIPATDTLAKEVQDNIQINPYRSAAAADFLGLIKDFSLPTGKLEIPHPYKQYSVQAAACRLGIPFTGHPMFGCDIIYNHPLNHGASIGRTAERDFLAFAHQVSKLEGGVYLSVGSAIMSPMIFEKSLSLAQNLALQAGKKITGHYILVVDLAKSNWNWSQGEPPADKPEYYLRYCKTFSRTGGETRYLCLDNRDFFLNLSQALK